MALQISYTDKMGVTHSEAYARIVAYRVKQDIKVAIFGVSIWHNVAARSKSDSSAEKERVVDITYRLTDTNFDNHMADSVVKANNVSVLSSLYTWLKTHKDGPSKWIDDIRVDNQGEGIDWTTATDV